jgi:8-oxo-dGTP pyrophosphatase MutT (NUDIX family)
MALPLLIRKWRDRLIPARGADAVIRQSGAIPYRLVDGKLTVLMVTSRRTGRWIFPKGGLDDGVMPWVVAAQEAFEEAGVEGEVETTPIGAYRDVKLVGLRRVAIEVDLYPLRLLRELDEWPEQRDRKRNWVVLPDAMRMLSNPRMSELAELLALRLGSGAGAPPFPG